MFRTAPNMTLSAQVFTLVLLLVADRSSAAQIPDSGGDGPRAGARYTNTWAVQIAGGDVTLARELGGKHGFQKVSHIFDDIYTFESLTKETTFSSQQKELLLQKDPQILWWQRQKVAGCELFRDITWRSATITDPKWGEQAWYMNATGRLSMRIVQAWNQCRVGRGVTVAAIDDGLWTENKDIKPNYDATASYDVAHDDADPNPSAVDSHGTSAAGIIAAAANDFCGVGVAPSAKIAGIRMFANGVTLTDALQAKALVSSLDKVDIYSCSWGTPRLGFSLKEMEPLEKAALQKGMTQGRGGKGAIYVFAAGNGGEGERDSCAYDKFTNAVNTIGISGMTEEGRMLKTGEKCSAMMATVIGKSTDDSSQRGNIYSPGNGAEVCTTDFAESSAAAPIAAGIIALALEANSNLTWRDVQHLIARTSTSGFVSNPPDPRVKWTTNAAGFTVSSSFGFGLLNAEALVKSAVNWSTVPPVQTCDVRDNTSINETLPRTVTPSVNGCQIRNLEHVRVYLLAKFESRGLLKVTLQSPSGTESLLIPGRPNDNWSRYLEVTVTSVQFWGERPEGNWTLKFESTTGDANHTGILYDYNITFYGTASGNLPMPTTSSGTTTPSSGTTIPSSGAPPCGPTSSSGTSRGHTFSVVSITVILIFLLVLS